MGAFADAGFDALKSDVMAVVTPIQNATGTNPDAPPQDPTKPPPPANPARAVADVAGAAGAVLGLPMQLVNDGFALATSGIAAMFPALPAATMGSLYVGPPHGHLHPPSLVPPAPAPIPLPSIGPVLLGTCIRVLIEGMPAARAGDIGIAVTCCGFVPAFEIKTGSSNVFIGGARAARVMDFCMECAPGAGALNALAKVGMAVGAVAGIAGAAADMADADQSAAAGDAAMAAAQSLSAAMNAAQTAVDLATTAIRMAMGKDIAVPPGMGFVTALTSSTVQIGGFPMVNIPDPLHLLFEKFKKMRANRRAQKERDAANSQTKCETCG
ncbi:PAAR domain-containing protein [Pendulispora brunnea]|uniref:PAAR domain-containing protein n=1 Tax=Pendulispora brunnea TaxID=2905690 RepID=A0ABZ2KNP7_9BACT